MKLSTVLPFAGILLAGSCSPFKLSLPPTLQQDSAARIHARHARISLFRHRLDVAGYKDARIWSGTDLARTSQMSLAYYYHPVNPIVHYIFSHLEQEVLKEKRWYRIALKSGKDRYMAVCKVEDYKEGIRDRKLLFSVPAAGIYTCQAVIIPGGDTSRAWLMRFNGSTSGYTSPTGALKEPSPQSGVLSGHGTEIKIICPEDTQNGEESSLRFEMPVSYNFVDEGKVIAAVDRINKDVWLSRSLPETTRMVVLIAGICLLMKAK